MAIIVILRHCGQKFFDAESYFNIIITNGLSPIAVPTFFAISGYLFFKKKRDLEAWKKYIIRIIKLYIVWTILFLPLIVKGWSGFLNFVQHVIFDGSYYHLWFLPSLIVAVTIVYFLSKKMSNIYLLFVTLLMYICGTWVDTYLTIPTLGWTIYKTIFLTTRNGLFFGCLFIVIGKIIAEGKKINLLYFILGIVSLMVEGSLFYKYNNLKVINMNFASIFLVPYILYVAVQHPKCKFNINGNMWRKVSTVLFCCHPYAITIMFHLSKQMGISPLISTELVVITTVIGALLIVKLSEQYKILKNIY